ncbi:nitronate monooxygenase [Comamonas testosteroni]|uniref:NAD(P)H-dependent flavin oxidoreductase n=1 Tax=Comamonas testosteroni TaxID=285 RepID=UPI002DBA9743|nr:nitronate monooxygenase [Comamonas testosteroni]MEB5966522.1 nitronate monooxygenase [Comamonas testosteroni]
MSKLPLWMTGLGLQHPIIQAPMAGTSTPQLAAAVSNAYALGSVGIGAYGLEQARQHIEQTRALTDRPFNVNLFCHRAPVADAEREAQWLRYLAPEFERYGASVPSGLRCIYESALGNARLQAMLLELRPTVVSFHFGLPEQSFVDALRAAGITTLACATSLDEARQIEQAGVDVIVAQGMEAGGHRGAFVPEQDTLMGTFALVRLLARESRLPVVAAGGIMDGAGIAAALQLGACAVQMGTAFILCPESAASQAYRAELQGDSAQHTAITTAISGRPARGMFNRLHQLGRDYAGAMPAYPMVYDAGKALHQAASSQGSSDYAAHWAGQGAPLARAMPAAELVRTLAQELEQAEHA